MSTQFAHDLRTVRKNAGYTQGDIAHLLSSHQSVVSDLERGRLRPSLEQIIDLSLIHGKSFESFFAEVMVERRKYLITRLASLPALGRNTAHTFNRPASLSKLARRLKQYQTHGGA